MNNQALRITVLTIIVLLIVSLRILFIDFANFAPIAAAGIFAIYHFRNKALAIIIPLLAFFASDVVIQIQTGYGLYAGRSFDYLAILAGIGIAYFIFKQSKSWTAVLGATVIGSLAFFVLSNFAVWAFGTMYVKSFDGLLLCYSNAIPFYRGTFFGDLLFTGVFFGVFELLTESFPKLQLAEDRI